MPDVTERPAVVLSEENRRLLEEICAYHRFDSADVAREDPNLALYELLKKLNEVKDNPSKIVYSTLDQALRKGHFRRLREEAKQGVA